MVICLALGGCRSILGIEEPVLGDGGPSADAASDAGACFGEAPYLVCPTIDPTTDRVVDSSLVLSTDTDCTEVVGGLCVVSARDLTISTAGVIRAVGTRPLVLLAAGQLTIDGTVDVGGHGGISGPGVSDSMNCLPAVAPTPGVNGGGGAAGGTFATRGGRGGAGAIGTNAGGIPQRVALDAALHAGCAGGFGADSSPSVHADPGGGGGGAVYLIGGEALILKGTINASGGGGGRGLAPKSGGSGGGAGGMILLWSPSTTGSATLIANGGGGGGGADNGANGLPGQEATGLGAPLGGGGGGGAGAGRGGAGAAGSGDGVDGVNDSTNAGGGGGGGGGGRILLLGAHGGLMVQASPPAS